MDKDITDLFKQISCWSRGDLRAPNKPILLLIALSAAQSGERWLRFDTVEPMLRKLLLDFGPPRTSQHPEYAFWRLQRDGLWEIPLNDRISRNLTKQGDAKVQTLRELKTEGGFTQAVFNCLSEKPDILKTCAEILLQQSLPTSLHEEFLEAIGLSLGWVGPQKRTPKFRQEIIRIYERRCAVCGYDGQLGQSSFGLEAAHVKWHAAGGPDIPGNGIALCSFHHVAFDRGALSLDDERQILISQDVAGSTCVDDLLLRFVGSSLRKPQPGTESPSLEYIQWHRREVFRNPARISGMNRL